MTDTPQEMIKAPQKKKIPFRFSLLFLAIIVVWMVSTLSHSKLLPAGSAAPPWELKTAERLSDTLSLEELRGKTVVLDFWGIGCPPCMQEMFELEAVWMDLKDKNVIVVGVASWGESQQDALWMKKKKRVTYPFVIGTREMLAAYKVDSIPMLYIIDPKGRIAASHQGFWDRASLKDAVLDAAHY